MGKVKNLVAIGIVALVSLSIVGCKMIQKTPEAIQKETVAKVGDQTITRGEVEKLMTGIIAQYAMYQGPDAANNSQIREQAAEMAVNSLVNNQVILQEAVKLKTVPSDADIQKQINDGIAKQEQAMGGKEKFQAGLKAMGMTQAEYEKELKDQIIIQNTVKKEVTDKINVTDAQVQDFYNNNKMQFTTPKSGADVSHILVKTKEEAEKIEADLKKDNGNNFAALAKEYSQDPGSKDKGGSLGFVPYSSTQLVQPFMDAMRKLTKDGEISPPVQSQFGWHVIRVENVKLAYEPFASVKDKIKEQLVQQETQTKEQQLLEQWKKDLGGVKTYDKVIKEIAAVPASSSNGTTNSQSTQSN